MSALDEYTKQYGEGGVDGTHKIEIETFTPGKTYLFIEWDQGDLLEDVTIILDREELLALARSLERHANL